ncbi:UNVERIFIED_CONTAM: hypothetical protein Slati_2313900 [Sesamum latifolium]|uniref:Uncharacterized protein n=1 Tax=Sesamum latifolium TaxID=2727402 RepID=A0AAW2W903_9LAMI
MANLHVRSNSLPSKSHPIVSDVEDQLCRLRSSEGTSTSATSVISNLATLRDLHEGINNLIQMPSTQQAISHENSEKWTILHQAKQRETATADDINAYMTSRKQINKMVKKFIKNFKNLDKNCTALLHEESDVRAVTGMLKETEAFGFSVLNSQVGKDMNTIDVLKQLKASEMAIQELEEELEAFFRSLLKTRVSLLNALNH